MMQFGADAVARVYSWTYQEKSIETLDDVAGSFATIGDELEATRHACLTIWKTKNDPKGSFDAVAKKLQRCQEVINRERKEIFEIEDDKKFVAKWKQLSDLEVKQLLFSRQAHVLQATLKDPQYAKFVPLFRQAVTLLKAQKNTSAGDRIRAFQDMFAKVETAVNEGQDKYCKTVLREGVLFLEALYQGVERSRLDESQPLDTFQNRFKTLLQGVDSDEAYEEDIETKMQELSFDDSIELQQLFAKQCKQVELKSGRYFIGWNPLAERNYPHIIASVKKMEIIAKKLQAMEELLAIQLPKICTSELVITSSEHLFYKKELAKVQAELVRVKKELYLGDYPAEMKEGLTYFSRLDVLVRHVGFASEMFFELGKNFMPVANAQKRLMKYLHRPELELLDFDNPRRTFSSVCDLYRTCAASLDLAKGGEEIRNQRVDAIQRAIVLRGKATVELNRAEKELQEQILQGQSLGVGLSEEKMLRLQSLLAKMALKCFAFKEEERRSEDKIINTLLVLSIKRDNADILAALRDRDFQFSQLLHDFGLTKELAQSLLELETQVQTGDMQRALMITNGSWKKAQFTRESLSALMRCMKNKTAFSLILMNLFK